MNRQPSSAKTKSLLPKDLPPGPLPPALQPPLLGQLLLEWVLPEALQEPVLGDLQEEFLEKRQQNPAQARWWYRKQALRTCWHFLHQTKGDWLMFIFSLLFFIGISVWVMWLSSADSLMMFYDFPSLALIFPTALLFAVGATSRNTAQQAVAFLFEPKSGLAPVYYQQIQHFFEVLGKSGLLLGWFTTLIGIVAMANGINADNFAEAFGPSLGVCLLTLLYSYGLKTITYIAAQKVRFVAIASTTHSEL